MRPISFPETLDVYDFCDEQVQAMLKTNRDRHGDDILGSLKQEDGGPSGDAMDTEEALAAPLLSSSPSLTGSEAVISSATAAVAASMDEDEAALQDALKLSMNDGAGAGVGATTAAAFPGSVSGVDVKVGPGIPQDFQGNYQLFGIVTHKVRSRWFGKDYTLVYYSMFTSTYFLSRLL